MGQGSAFMPSHKTMAPKSLQPPLLIQPLARGTASGAPEANNAPFPNLPPEVSSLGNSQKIYPKSSNGFSSGSQQGPLVWPVLPLWPPLPLPLSRLTAPQRHSPPQFPLCTDSKHLLSQRLCTFTSLFPDRLPFPQIYFWFAPSLDAVSA